MANINIVDDYRFFGASAPVASLQADDQKKLNAVIRNHFLNFPEVKTYLSTLKGRFRLSIRSDAVAVKSAEGSVLRLFPLDAQRVREARRIDRIGRYYQNLNYVGRDLSKDLALMAASGEKVCKLRQAAIPAFKDKVFTGIKIGDNALTLTRDVLSVHPEVGPNNAFVNNAGIVAGSIWSFFAVREILSGIDDLDHAREIGDEEGKRRAGARLGGGLFSATGSALYLSGKAWDLAGGIGVAPVALGLSTNLLFGAGAVLGMGIAGLGVYRCLKFRGRIDRYLNNPDPRLSQAMKLKGALRFLKDAMSATPEERARLIKKIDAEHPFLNSSEKQELLQADLERLTETKVKYMKRRTSNQSLGLLLDPKSGIDALLPLLERGEGVKEAEQLLEKVKTETWKKIALYAISFVASLIGLIAILAGSFGTFGALPFVLFGITAATYLVLALYNLYKSWSRSESELLSAPHLQPLDLTSAEAHEFH